MQDGGRFDGFFNPKFEYFLFPIIYL